MGRKKRPVYAIVAADSRSPRDGRYIEDLGRYNPLVDPAELTINSDRCLYWLETGAEPSDTVRSLLSREGVMLALHMRRKGKAEDEIISAVEAHKAQRAAKLANTRKPSADERRIAALKEEETRAAEQAAELAKQKAAAAAKAKDEAEAAMAAAAAEREAAAAEAKAEQAEANAEQAAADSAAAPAAEAAPEAEAVAEEAAPAEAEAAPEAEAVAEEAAPAEAEAAAEEGEETKDA